MTDFLLELRCEEIPARMQKGARAELEKLFRRELDEAGVATGELTVWSTPRRLALIARDLPEATKAVREEAKGPPVAAPDQAVDGFCRKMGLGRDALEVRDVKGRETYFAVKDIPGRATSELLAEAIPAIIRDFSWPKSMRWGGASVSTESLRWVRPLSGIVALFGGEVVACEVDGIAAGCETKGHRFHSSGAITIGSADDYAMKLRAGHVIADHVERESMVRDGAASAALDAGLRLVEDEGLVVENAGLTEWPVPLLGRFDDEFLTVPPEVIQLTARVNQKYFVCEDSAGKLANAFVCTANIAAEDGGAAIVDGNRKVLAARLSDARFFWELDQKTSLEDHSKKLGRITFHEKLGTVANKVERVAKLARWLCEEKIVAGDPDLAEQAARLCKADLVTEMVGEFPELQGLMGGYYARAEGLPDEVADAIRDHYKPVGQGDDVPTAPVTVAVSLADKLDTICSFLFVGLHPTGSKDPFALRRAAIGSISLIIESGTRVNLAQAFKVAMGPFPASFLSQDLIDEVRKIDSDISLLESSRAFFDNMILKEGVTSKIRASNEATRQAVAQHHLITNQNILDFFADRLKVQQREAGVRHDLIDAVFALGGEDDLVCLLARVQALQAFIDTEDGVNLLAGYKRAANILKKEEWEDTAATSSIPHTIPHTGEEDPLSQVDDPEMRAIVAARLKTQHSTSLAYTPEPAEAALIAALDDAAPKAATAIEAEDFAAAMSALASLRAPIDAFFEEVTVNDDDAIKRSTRLALLARFRAAVHNVADFSRIEG